VFVALVIQHAMRIRQIAICGRPAVQYFSTLSKKGKIFEKHFEHKMSFDFPYEIFLHVK
jgi:hypothetical protein